MFRRSATASFGVEISSHRFVTAADSPVRAASSTARFTATLTRQSAGTRSPARRTTTSPGTTSRASMLRSAPSRITCARGAAIRRSASSARSARYSCTKPSSTANRTIAAMTIASMACPSTPGSSVATRRIRIRTFLNCAASVCHADVRATSCSSLNPTAVSRRVASAALNPKEVVPNASKTDSTGWECQASSGRV